jgi:hypothetical protein
LSIAYLDDAVNAVHLARHIHTGEWAWNHLRAAGHRILDVRALSAAYGVRFRTKYRRSESAIKSSTVLLQ